MKIRTGLSIAAVVALAVCSASNAALLNLTQQFPDITAGFIDVDYTYNGSLSEGMFNVTGFAIAISNGGPLINVDNGSLAMNSTIGPAGNLIGGVPGDDLVITGSFDENGDTIYDYTGVLLTGEVNNFGFINGGGDIFEWTFTVTGGALAIPAWYGAPGGAGGVILDANFPQVGGFTGSFTSDFSTGFAGAGNADIFYVPEPASLLLMISAAGLWARRRLS